jgi:hypothetical protein
MASSVLLFIASSSIAQVSFLENGSRIILPSDAGYLMDSPTRTVIDLAGDWTFSTDGGATGTVRLPAVYRSSDKVLFSRRVDLSPEQLSGYAFQLVMLGAGHAVEVTVNGDFLTSHSGGYSTIAEPLSRTMLQPGRENVIRLLVNNKLDSKLTLPPRREAWGSSQEGGVSREIYLLGTPPLYVQEASTSAELSDNFATSTVITKVHVDGVDTLLAPGPPNTPSSFGVACEVVEKLSGGVVARSAVVPLVRKDKEWNVATVSLTVTSPKLWTPESPDLYILKTYLVRISGKEIGVIDELDQTLGIRHVATSGGHILLNGRRLTLRGVTWYEDSPAHGSAMTAEERERDIVQIKTLGANLVRFAGHPPHPYMLNLCDRYGLFALVELPVDLVPGPVLGTESFQELALTAVREMIGRDRGHPSVLAWGLGDEFASSHPSAAAYVRAISRSARALDNRPLYFGAVADGDSCTALMDLAAVCIGGTDIRDFRAKLESWRSLHKTKPVIAFNVGTEVLQDDRNGYSDPLSQEAQARFFLQRLEILKSVDYDGVVVWSFNDWIGGRPSLTVHVGDPNLRSLGLVNRQREKRLAFDAVRSVFEGERFSALPMGTHSSGTPIVFVLVGFVILVGLAYMYNSSRRFRESLNRSVMNSYNFYVDVRDQRAVSILHTALIGIVESLAISVIGASILLRYRDNRVADQVLSYLIPDDRIKLVLVELVWDPMRFIFIGGGVVFAGFLLLSLGLLLFRLVLRARVHIYHTFTAAIWSGSPLLILVPLGMIMYRVMESPSYVIPLFAVLAILHLLVGIRLVKGTAILYDVSSVKAYLWSALVAVAAVFLVYLTTDLFSVVPMYAEFLSSTIAHLR